MNAEGLDNVRYRVYFWTVEGNSYHMFDDIVKRHKPRGWTVTYSKRRTEIALAAKRKDELGQKRSGLIDCAETDFNRRIIRAPIVGCEYTLQILLHEFGHVHLKHVVPAGQLEPAHLPHHKMEFEADEWSMNIMRLEGVTVTKAIKRSAARYLRHCIEQDLAKGQTIHTHIAKRAKITLKEKEDE